MALPISVAGKEEGRELHRSYATLDSSDGKKSPPRVRTEKQLKVREQKKLDQF